MTAVYFDTSALVKVVIQEAGSVTSAQAWQAADAVVCSRLAHVESRAALAMAARLGRLSPEQAAGARATLTRHWDNVTVLEVTEPIVDLAGDLAETDALRGFDAVHLASAVRAAVDILVTADRDMLHAARRHGIRVIDART